MSSRDELLLTAATAAGTPQSNGACPVCSAQPETPVRLSYLEQDFNHVPPAENPFSGRTVLVCQQCGFGWADPPAAWDRLQAFYRLVYRHVGSVNVDAVDTSTFTGLGPLDPRAVAHVLLAKMFTTLAAGDAALDIGPGQGGSFHALARLAPGMTHWAFEADRVAGRFLQQKLNVQVIPEMFRPSMAAQPACGMQRFKLIIMSHVAEHFNGTDAVAVFQEARTLLAQDGVLVCEVPHNDWRRYAGMRRNDSPHLAFFSAEALRQGLIRAGFAVKFLDTCGQRYDIWWAATSAAPGYGTHKERPPRSAWIKRLYKSLPGRMPRTVERWANDALLLRGQMDRMWRSDELNYGGERTCLRVVAAHADNNQ